jgi:hypothetical protein
MRRKRKGTEGNYFTVFSLQQNRISFGKPQNVTLFLITSICREGGQNQPAAYSCTYVCLHVCVCGTAAEDVCSVLTVVSYAVNINEIHNKQLMKQ